MRRMVGVLRGSGRRDQDGEDGGGENIAAPRGSGGALELERPA